MLYLYFNTRVRDDEKLVNGLLKTAPKTVVSGSSQFITGEKV
jgi:hypothetical protein